VEHAAFALSWQEWIILLALLWRIARLQDLTCVIVAARVSYYNEAR
jgi:hypothetical protein